MPDTNVFAGVYSSLTDAGGIEISGIGDEATITFEDEQTRKKQATIKIYELKELKKTKLYNEAVAAGSETFVHKWFTKRTPRCLIKYAASKQLAFVYTSKGPISEELEKAIDFNGFHRLIYFKEAFLAKELKTKLGFGFAELRVANGITETKLEFFVDNSSAFFELLPLGFPLPQLVAMDAPRLVFLFANKEKIAKLLQRGLSAEEFEHVELNKLTKYFALGDKVDVVLEFISIQQLLGLNNRPLPLKPDFAIKPPVNKLLVGRNSFGNFTISYCGNTLEFKYDNKTTQLKAQRQVFFGVLVEHLREHYQEKIQDKAPQELVHNWYMVTQFVDDKQKKLSIYYCPEFHLVVQDLCDELFPKEHIVSLSLEVVNYYRELEFINFLQLNACAIKDFRRLPGMSQAKLEFLCANFDNMKKMMAKGLHLRDFAQADEPRLRYVLSNFAKAEAALEFVSVFDLLALKQASSARESLSFFNKGEAKEDKAASAKPVGCFTM